MTTSRLSNTATPIFYGKFRKKVLSGQIPVCKEIAQQMNRVDELIRNPAVYYDPAPVEGYVRFCESELTLTDGSDLILLDTFKLWAESILGWYYYTDQSVYVPYTDKPGGRHVKMRVKKRLISKLYLIVARGSAKSMFASTLQAFFLNVDTTTTHQVTTAPTMKQADEVMSPFRTAITRSRGPLFKFLTHGSLQNTTGSRANRAKLISTKKGIENHFTGSLLEIRPMSIDKLQGLRVKFTTVDEWLSGDVREDVVGAIEQGASKLSDYLIVAISSEGTVRNASGDDIKMELKKILKGEYKDPHTAIWYYKLDTVKEVAKPELWLKANPNLGLTVQYEAYHRDVERAENAPSTRNDILAKRFGLPMAGYTYFFTYKETLPQKTKKSYWKMPCSLGLDLSQGDDFCSFSFFFPLGGKTFGIKTLSFISSDTMVKLPGSMRAKYETFVQEGSLIVHDGVVLDIEGAVYDDVEQFIEDNQYEVLSLGYDPYNAREFIEKWATYHGDYGVEKVAQGVKTESVPLGEIKKLAGNRDLYFDEQIMVFAMSNAMVAEDTNGNRKLLKKRREAKIDPVAATMDAYIAYKRNKEMFH